MKTIDYVEIADTKEKHFPAYFSHFYKEEKILFFDIETTGFSARNTTLYLIGVLWYENEKIQIRQWFNEDGNSEADLLTAFEKFSKDFTMLVHFNGLMFDLPYLKQKAEMLNTEFTIDSCLQQFDIFKEIRSYKKILALNNMKQVTIEQYLGCDRADTYTGGELINIYQRYVARPDQEKEDILLLHNHDDLLGMPQISQILNYKAFFTQLSIEDIQMEDAPLNDSQNNLTIIFHFPDYAFLPNRITYSKDGLYINAFEQKANLQIPLTVGSLKHYFSDYKNYFYLPAEDMAIHKSVAAFVETANKQRATKSTCYVQKTGTFLPCFSKENADIFQYDITDKTLYQSTDSVLSDHPETISAYIIQCLNHFTL